MKASPTGIKPNVNCCVCRSDPILRVWRFLDAQVDFLCMLGAAGSQNFVPPCKYSLISFGVAMLGLLLAAAYLTTDHLQVICKFANSGCIHQHIMCYLTFYWSNFDHSSASGAHYNCSCGCKRKRGCVAPQEAEAR